MGLRRLGTSQQIPRVSATTDQQRVDPRTWAAAKPSGIRRFVPILRWLPGYDRRFLRFDVIAGATVWGLLVPESIAYAGLAGLPPQAGLYTLLATLAAYAVFGTSRHLVAAATSAAAVLLAFLGWGSRRGGRCPLRRGRRWARALLRWAVLARGALAAGVRGAVPLASGDGGVRVRAGDLRDRQPAAQAVRDREGIRRHDRAVRPLGRQAGSGLRQAAWRAGGACRSPRSTRAPARARSSHR